MKQHTILLEGQLSPAQEKTYVHLPFDVPERATRVDIAYTYSQRIGAEPWLSGGNTLDLGIFDSRGIDFLHAGFRGWSGSERASVFLSETGATPGYLAGPVMPGRWHVLLGLYKIAEQGCTYRATITITTDDDSQGAGEMPAAVTRLPASPIQPPYAPWLRGELHCHTIHSDGDSRPIDLVQRARARGLDFLAITDHNTISTQRELEDVRDPGLVLIRGFEVTTFKGHLNVWGMGEWVDFRARRPEEMQAAIRFALERGAVTGCNHPKPVGPAWEYPEVDGYDCIEVWNGPWYVMNEASLNFWLEQLARGKRIVAIGGSDYHRAREPEQRAPRAPGTPTTWVYVPGTQTETSILQAVRAGHVSLSAEPDGPFLELRLGEALGGDTIALPADGQVKVRVHCQRGVGQQLRLLDQRGVLFEQKISQVDVQVAAELLVAQSLYVRAELRGGDHSMQALTNPIYFDTLA